MAGKTAAGLVLLRADRKVLLLLRSRRETTWPGVWGFPGGMAEDGEEPLEAALRECAEETGGVPPLAAVGTPLRSRRPDGGVFLAFPALLADGARWSPVLNGEHEAWGWFMPGLAPGNTHPGAARTLAALWRH